LEAEIGVADPSTTALFACGPVPMVKSLARILSDGPFFCQVSMEERMACGVGACLGCAVAVHSLDGRTVYQRVCKDGPVFGLRQVCMDR
jgi:dihydroorotate dehydrogenase electron transfer subunit